MNEVNNAVQQEIAPISVVAQCDDVAQPVEKKKRTAIFFKLKSTKSLVYLATFVALAVFFKLYSVDIGGNIKITFFYLPIFLAGALFGPLYGFFVGIIGEVVGAFIKYSVPNPILFAGNALMGVIVALVFLLRIKPAIKLILAAALVCIICSLGINTYGLSVFYGVKYWQQLIAGVPPRVVMQPIVIAANAMIIIPLYYASENLLSRPSS